MVYLEEHHMELKKNITWSQISPALGNGSVHKTGREGLSLKIGKVGCATETE